MQNIKLDARLMAAAELVRGDIVADVGTDHGFLPIYLIANGAVKRAVASDIRSSPLERAKKNINENGLADVIDTVLTPGLSGIEAFNATDIVIAGMGGMTIIEILEAAPFVRERRTHLILQPMQHIAETREYLLQIGFCIDKEVMAEDDGKIYQIISAVYDGTKRETSGVSRMLGEYTIAHRGEAPMLFTRLCDKYISILETKTEGLKKSNRDCNAEAALLCEIERLRAETEEKWLR